jgi:uncharacterized protein YuzE
MSEDIDIPEEAVTESSAIKFSPPISVREDIISGGMTVSSAEFIESSGDQVVVRINGDGRVIGIPFVDDVATSIRSALE